MMELQTGKHQSIVTTSDMADALISYMEAPELPTIKTGFHELDLRTGGLRGGELILLAGRPGMGKTSMAQSLALNMANNEHHVVFLECEMPPLDLSMRWISALSKLPLGMIRNKGIRADEDMDKYIRASARFSELQITMLDASGWTVSKIRAEMLKLHKRKPVDALFIDYLQLLQPEKTSGNTNDAVADQSKRLKMLARELDVPIILLSQLNRGVESRDDKRPRLSDLRDSGAIEQDADAVLFLYRGHVYDEEIPPDRAELNVAKLRNGQPGMIPVRWNGTTTSYHNA
jgi:replicative DNA helicase